MWNFNTHRNRYVLVPCHGIKGTKSVRNIKEKIRSLFCVWLTSSPAVLSHSGSRQQRESQDWSCPGVGTARVGSVKRKVARGS